MNKILFTLSLLTTFPLTNTCYAEISLNRLFADHMVVQRDTKIPIWGWASSHENITIDTSWGTHTTIQAEKDGTWSTTIETPSAGGPFKMTLSGENEIVINDILSGEVWLCTGQSNMDFALEKFTLDAREPQYQPLVEYIRTEIKTANDPWIRHIEVPQTTSLFETKDNFEGEWISANPEQSGKITATGYFFAKELRKHLNVPIGLVECSWGGTAIQPWISEQAYLSNNELKPYFEDERSKAKETIAQMDASDYVDTTYIKKLEAWKNNGEKGNKPRPSTHPKESKQLSSTLYNGMLAAIVPYSIKGAIWYQGESNSGYMPNSYETHFTTLIESWRAEWGIGDFPFYWAQLAAYNVQPERIEGWAIVNNHLRRTLKLPNTGMAILHDLGEAKDIHPHNKMDVGKRFALLALENDYNIEVPATSGPLYKKFKIKQEKAIVTFSQIGTGLIVGHKNLTEDTQVVDEPLKWFEISGDDGAWKTANAKIISTKQIELSHPDIAHPTNVRYAWASNQLGANLYNVEGLPAAAFSTEN